MPQVKRSSGEMDDESPRKRIRASPSGVNDALVPQQDCLIGLAKESQPADLPGMTAIDRLELHQTNTLRILQQELDLLRQTLTCKICERLFYEPYVLTCGHTYCYSCLATWFTANKKKPCPSCRERITREPTPSYVIKDMVGIFVKRLELLPDGETLELHEEWRKQEADIVAKDKQNTKTGGLFRGAFGARSIKPPPRAPVHDEEDGVDRCPDCNWEIEDGECNNCGYALDDFSEDGFSGSDDSGEPGAYSAPFQIGASRSRSAQNSFALPHERVDPWAWADGLDEVDIWDEYDETDEAEDMVQFPYEANIFDENAHRPPNFRDFYDDDDEDVRHYQDDEDDEDDEDDDQGSIQDFVVDDNDDDDAEDSQSEHTSESGSIARYPSRYSSSQARSTTVVELDDSDDEAPTRTTRPGAGRRVVRRIAESSEDEEEGVRASGQAAFSSIENTDEDDDEDADSPIGGTLDIARGQNSDSGDQSQVSRDESEDERSEVEGEESREDEGSDGSA